MSKRAEPLDDGRGVGVMVASATHVIHRNRNGLHADIIIELAPERGEGGELQKPGDRSAMKEAGTADHVFVKRQDDERALLALIDAEFQELGVGREAAHASRFSGWRSDAPRVLSPWSCNRRALRGRSW